MASKPDAQEVLRCLNASALRITFAESCTGGLIAASLTALPGASAVFEQGFITYSNQAKQDMLGVSPETLQRVGAVSEEVAREMAEGARLRANADIALSVTGIAGPGPSEFKPEGRVCFGIATRTNVTLSETVNFGPLGRSEVRNQSARYGWNLILKALDTLSP